MPTPNDNANSSFLFSVEMAGDNTSPEQSDAFWTHAEIDAARWNQAFPYQLFLVKVDADGNYIQETSSDASKSSNWVFTLPFPPESLSITMPFAIQGMVTQGGYVEQHAGAPVRMLTLSGSLGVLPLRGAAPTRPQASPAQAIFGGTIQQAQRVETAARQFSSDFNSNNTNFQPNLVDQSLFSDADSDTTKTAKTSGYYQMRLLQEFFENYVAFKQTDKGKDHRLAFAIWKQQAVYLVTPMNFAVNFNAASPFEPLYQLQLKGWRRIDFNSIRNAPNNAFQPAARKPNALARMLSAISDARDVLENSRDILAAVGGDLNAALFEPLRQLSLFAKDAISVPLAFSDLPVQVLNDCQDAVVEYISTTNALTGAGDAFKAQAQRVVDAYNALAALGTTTSKVETGVAALTTVPSSAAADAALDVFRNPGDNYDLFKGLQPGKIHLPPATIKAIQAQRLSIRQLTRLDFEQMRDTVEQVAADFADAVGAGSNTYNVTFQRAVRATSKTPTPADFQVLFALNRVVMEMNRLAASGQTNRSQIRSIDYVAGLASRSGIAFTVPKSKFAVPMPYGITIEQVAQLYLGNLDRWIEIAALNGLRAPYVDELGFDLSFLTNGSGNQVTVADSSHLYVGQQVWISSANVNRITRRITKIEVLNPTTSVVTVDGDATIGSYTVPAGAVLHAFLPDTVNSMMMLYIPSDIEPSLQDYQTKAIPGLNEYDALLEVGGVDLLLTPTNDLAITPDGDCRLAVGLANIIQTARLRIGTVQGTLNRHPSYGLPVKVGQSVADFNAQTLLGAVKNLFNDDPTFTGVTAASVLQQGPGVTVRMNIGVRGQSQVIPIELNVKR